MLAAVIPDHCSFILVAHCDHANTAGSRAFEHFVYLPPGSKLGTAVENIPAAQEPADALKQCFKHPKISKQLRAAGTSKCLMLLPVLQPGNWVRMKWYYHYLPRKADGVKGYAIQDLKWGKAMPASNLGW